MSRFTSLKVGHIEKTTEDCVLVTLDVPEMHKAAFTFKQGQYLTLRAIINGESVQRSYSICSSPLDNEWRVGIKQVPHGLFSTFANLKLKEGDELESMTPAGNFYVDVAQDKQQNYVCFAAGSGITPMISIIKTHLQAEPEATFKLFYINQTVSSIILKEELEALKNLFMDRFEIFYFLTRQNRSVELFNGRIDKGKLETIFKTICDINSTDHYFICGPESMIFLIKDFLVDKSVQEDNIHFELFNIGDKKPKLAEEVVEKIKGRTCSVTLIEGGKTMEFELAMGGDNILDAALNNSADLPYACKGGVCSTCKAKLIEGKVDMPVAYGLEKEEIENGYVLTCQAFPLSEKVVVDFDS